MELTLRRATVGETHALTQSGHSITVVPNECRLPHFLQSRLLHPEQAVSFPCPKKPPLNGWKHTPHLPPPMTSSAMLMREVTAAPVALERNLVLRPQRQSLLLWLAPCSLVPAPPRLQALRLHHQPTRHRASGCGAAQADSRPRPTRTLE